MHNYLGIFGGFFPRSGSHTNTNNWGASGAEWEGLRGVIVHANPSKPPSIVFPPYVFSQNAF